MVKKTKPSRMIPRKLTANLELLNLMKMILFKISLLFKLC